MQNVNKQVATRATSEAMYDEAQTFVSKKPNESDIGQMKNMSEELFNFFPETSTLNTEYHYFAMNYHLSSCIIKIH